MNITDELQKLAALRQSGALTEEEFVAAKRQLLGGSNQPPVSPERETLGRAANRYVTYQMVWGVIGLIIFLIFFFGFFLPHFSSHPSIQIRPQGFP